MNIFLPLEALVVFLLVVLILYIGTRVVSAAYFRSREEFERGYVQRNFKRE